MDVIVEIDGVLASLEGRAHLAEKRHRRWSWSPEAEEFFELGRKAEPIGGVTDLLYGFFMGHPNGRVIVNTFRPSIYKADTLEWLYDNEIKIDGIAMRPGYQNIGEFAIKRNNLKRLRKAGFDPQLAIEWDEQSAQMYNEHGIRTLIWWKPQETTIPS